jgi:calcineurin-like phosphoesterase family protein
MPTIKHKAVLKEIFEAAMESGGSLDTYCDKVMLTSISKLPGSTDNFIILGDFTASDVRVGFLKEKYRIVIQEILCGSVVKEVIDGESEAEERGFELSKRVRTLLINNKTLVSVSYPTGAAKESVLLDSRQEFFLYEESLCSCYIMPLEMKVMEE